MEENTEIKVTWLVCLRVTKDFEPKIVSWKDTCGECGAAVWRAEQDIVDKVICGECAIEKMKQSDEEVKIMPPTQKQLDKLRSSRTRVKN